MALRQTGHALALTAARLGIAAIFLTAGYAHILDVNALAARVASAGYPAPKAMALLATLAELCGGLSVALGALTPLGCMALVLFMVPTTYSFHYLLWRHGVDAARQGIEFMKNLAITGGLVALFYSGPGPISFDYLVLRRSLKARSS